MGQVKEALPILHEVFSKNSNWALLLQRLPAAGLLRDDAEMMQHLLAA
jgi:hypothetical protein